MKKLIVLILAAVMALGLASAAAAEQPAEEAEPVVYDFGTEGIIDFPQLPESYKEKTEHTGTVTKVTYNNGTDDRYFNVYLPYGYEDSTDTYNVFYYAHGGGGCNPDTLISPDRVTATQKVIDHMFEDGVCEPFIIALVAWNPVQTGDEEADAESYQNSTTYFAQDELSRCVILYMDENYRTNVGRKYRAFGGYSAGGGLTWKVLLYDLKDFETFIPMSGTCGVFNPVDGEFDPEAAAAGIAEAITSQGMTFDDFCIFSATGSLDFALEGLATQMIAMRDNEMFKFGENTFFGVMEGIPHGDPYGRLYLYTYMPMVW